MINLFYILYFVIFRKKLNNFWIFLVALSVYFSAYFFYSYYFKGVLNGLKIEPFIFSEIIIIPFSFYFFKKIEIINNSINQTPIFIYLLCITIISSGFVMILYYYIFSFFGNDDSLNFWMFTILFTVQARIILINKNERLLKWFKKLIFLNFTLYERKIIIDYSFVLLYILFNKNIYLINVMVFLYGLRLFRLLLLVPKIESIYKSVYRGLKIASNYTIAFMIILFVLTINSRFLFKGLENNHFSGFYNSFFTNFKIVMGSGFDLADQSSHVTLVSIYVLVLTLLIGLVFTSAFTALVTDSLLQKKDDVVDVDELAWYKQRPDEDGMIYVLRIYEKIASI